jgi:transposase
MDSELFEGWFEQIFLPIIKPGSVIILDNARFHRKDPLYDLAEEKNCILLFLSPYSPDFNPIEKVWANLKNFLRSYSRNFNTIQSAIMSFFETR